MGVQDRFNFSDRLRDMGGIMVKHLANSQFNDRMDDSNRILRAKVAGIGGASGNGISRT